MEVQDDGLIRVTLMTDSKPTSERDPQVPIYIRYSDGLYTAHCTDVGQGRMGWPTHTTIPLRLWEAHYAQEALRRERDCWRDRAYHEAGIFGGELISRDYWDD